MLCLLLSKNISMRQWVEDEFKPVALDDVRNRQRLFTRFTAISEATPLLSYYVIITLLVAIKLTKL